MTWVGLIWAEAHGGVIGAQGGMPWHVPEDLAHFKDTTLENIVITRQQDWAAVGARRAATVEEAVRGQDRVWIIGGAEIFRQVIADADRLEVTELDVEVDGDAYAPSKSGWRLVDEGEWRTSRSGIRYRFLGYER